jgi:nucleotide-binding universal stress UspA family protein
LSPRVEAREVYRSILLPTDGSWGTDRAAANALSLAQTYGAAVHVLYVVDTTALPLDAHSQATFARMEEAGHAAVEDVLDRATEAGVDPVVGTVRAGTPHREIVDYADEHDVDLVVMGTHGRSGLDRVLLGSVATRVVRLADVPVMVVPVEDEGAADGTG